eukprot:27988-Eustigmatos_ZCMA.PRE.1
MLTGGPVRLWGEGEARTTNQSDDQKLKSQLSERFRGKVRLRHMLVYTIVATACLFRMGGEPAGQDRTGPQPTDSQDLCDSARTG